MQKNDFMAKRETFSFGKFAKNASSTMMPSPGPHAVTAMPATSWTRNESPVRCGPVAPTTDTAGNVLGFEATNPDSRSPRSWSDYLRGCLEFLGCK